MELIYYLMVYQTGLSVIYVGSRSMWSLNSSTEVVRVDSFATILTDI